MRQSCLGLCVLLLLASSALPQGARKRGGAVVRGVHGEVLGAKHNVDRALGGNYSQPLAPRAPISPLIGGVFEVTLNNTGTGWDEVFLIGVPKAPVTPAPVLVVYHGYGETPRDLLYSTSYFQKGMARGWIVVAPTGAHKYNFAIDYAQENVLAALTWVVTY